MATDFKEIKNILREYCDQWYAKKMHNLEEMNKFLETHNQPRLMKK